MRLVGLCWIPIISDRIWDLLEELVGFDAGGAHPHVHRHHLVRWQIPGQFHHHLDLSSSSAGPRRYVQRDLQPILQYPTHSTHIPHTFHTWRIMEVHGGACLYIYIYKLYIYICLFISYPRFPSQLAPCCSPDPGLQGCLWSLHSFYETSTVFFGNEHLTEQKPDETRNIHATRYLMFKNVTKGYRIHTLAACSMFFF